MYVYAVTLLTGSPPLFLIGPSDALNPSRRVCQWRLSCLFYIIITGLIKLLSTSGLEFSCTSCLPGRMPLTLDRQSATRDYLNKHKHTHTHTIPTLVSLITVLSLNASFTRITVLTLTSPPIQHIYKAWTIPFLLPFLSFIFFDIIY
jgi:hypothetical protein